MQFRPIRPRDASRVVPGRERRGAEIACRSQKIAKLDALVAADTGDRRLAARVGIDEIVDDFGAKAALVIEHVMRDPETLSDASGIVNVLSRAARAFAPGSGLMIVELQRNADHLETLLYQQGRGHRRIDPARHRNT